jgi:hypothetical protein
LLEQPIETSALIVAHPDDEILWFSSVLENVSQLIFCYSDCLSRPEWSMGRRKSLVEHPLRDVMSLEITESEVFGKMNWRTPEVCEYGLKLNIKDYSTQLYERNFHRLRDRLKDTLSGVRQVITHNPWGEYGNEEHVQVYRAVKSLQSELGLNMWFSNYASNKSIFLLAKYLGRLDSVYVKNPTNKSLAASIRSIYEKNQCWTWYKDWEWGNEEALIRETSEELEKEMSGCCLPFNLIKVKPQKEKRTRRGFFHVVFRSIKNLAIHRDL